MPGNYRFKIKFSKVAKFGKSQSQSCFSLANGRKVKVQAVCSGSALGRQLFELLYNIVRHESTFDAEDRKSLVANSL